jgi:hypothetical protein
MVFDELAWSSMPTVRFILGLCGSGKSRFVRDLSSKGFEPFDEGVTSTGVSPWLSQDWDDSKYRKFLTAVGDGKNCVVAEIAYYFESSRTAVAAELRRIRSDVTIEWFSFENDAAAANENCRRDHERTPQQIESNIEQNLRTLEAFRCGSYTLPADVVVLQVSLSAK